LPDPAAGGFLLFWESTGGGLASLSQETIKKAWEEFIGEVARENFAAAAVRSWHRVGLSGGGGYDGAAT
jgi:hypothetical protein